MIVYYVCLVLLLIVVVCSGTLCLVCAGCVTCGWVFSDACGLIAFVRWF